MSQCAQKPARVA